MNTAQQTEIINEYLNSLGLKFKYTYVPFSISRNADKFRDIPRKMSNLNNLSLNFKVDILRDNKPSMRIDYSQGIGHMNIRTIGNKLVRYSAKLGRDCPDQFYDAVVESCNKGLMMFADTRHAFITATKHRTPDDKDIIYCMLNDVHTLDCSFPEFCYEYGYNDDSIKDKALYDLCQAQSRDFLKLISKDELEKLQELYQDY